MKKNQNSCQYQPIVCLQVFDNCGDRLLVVMATAHEQGEARVEQIFCFRVAGWDNKSIPLESL